MNLSGKKEISLDISAKYEILSEKKLEEELVTGCSVMVISTDIKLLNGKLYMIVESNLME